jgi:CRISPR-associated endonuclease/helicase Cas3
VGSNFDFDGLVTECAALDSLCQRFGRLDRLGQLGESHASIVARSDHVAKWADDLIYGSALVRTWEWLNAIAAKPYRAVQQLTRRRPSANAKATVDFGSVAMSSFWPRAPQNAYGPAARAPMVLPAHLDFWAQTSPIPHPDPEVSIFLHGAVTEPPDVQIVWRADLDSSEPQTWTYVVALLPPATLEAMPAPLGAVRAWLASLPPPDIADIEGGRADGQEGPLRKGGRPALRWHGVENSEPITTEQLRPGDTVVVPAGYGGADEFGWNPASTQAVTDIGEMSAVQRGVPALRLHRALLGQWLLGAAQEITIVILSSFNALISEAGPEHSDAPASLLTEVLDAIATLDEAPDEIRSLASILACDNDRRAIPYPNGQGVLVRGGRKARAALRESVQASAETPTGEFTDEDNTSVLTRPVTLRAHSDGVREWTRRLSAACGISKELTDDLELAGFLHDVGKADRRFQIMLHRGDEPTMLEMVDNFAMPDASQLLAKSGLDRADPAVFQRAREISCYPDGGRHEAQSVALIIHNEAALARAHNRDLVLHLVGSHHGCGRPFMPVTFDPAPLEVAVRLEDIEYRANSAHGLERLDSDVSGRFWRLVRRYGWYGLAYLEAIVRLSDRLRSESEQIEESEQPENE